MAIEDWMGALKTVFAGIDGIEQAHIYEDLPASIQTVPSAIILVTSGSQSLGDSGVNVAIHRVQATVYVSLQVLGEAYGAAIPFIKKVRDAVGANMTLGGLVSYCLPVDPPEDFYAGPGQVRYGDKEHVGIIFRLKVKEIEDVTIGG